MAVRARSRAPRRRGAAMHRVPSPQAIDRKYYCPSNHAHALRPCFVTRRCCARYIRVQWPYYKQLRASPSSSSTASWREREVDHRRTHAHCDTTTNVHCAERHDQKASVYTVTVGTRITTCGRSDYITTTACSALERAAIAILIAVCVGT